MFLGGLVTKTRKENPFAKHEMTGKLRFPKCDTVMVDTHVSSRMVQNWKSTYVSFIARPIVTEKKEFPTLSAMSVTYCNGEGSGARLPYHQELLFFVSFRECVSQSTKLCIRQGAAMMFS